MIIINNLEEMKKYYEEETNTYVFRENVKFTFDLCIKANINALNIEACDIEARNIEALNINAGDIEAGDIDARNIEAGDIDYYGVCFTYNNIICNSIKSKRKNHKHFVLDGKLIIKGSEKNADNNK